MAEKNGVANALDKAFEALGKRAKNSDNDMLNILPKPDTQTISDGLIVWRWNLDTCIVESVLATRNSNPLGLEKDTYVVNIQMPKTEECYYSLFDDTAKEIGQALMSAWNWQHIWKLHAGDFLLEILSQEPIAEPESNIRPPEFLQETPQIVEVETIEVVEEAIQTTPSFDNTRLEP